MSSSLCQFGVDVGKRGSRTSTGAGFEAVALLDFDFFLGISMPRARCDCLFFSQTDFYHDLKVG